MTNDFNKKLQQQVDKENETRKLFNTILNSDEDMDLEIDMSQDDLISFIQRLEN